VLTKQGHSDGDFIFIRDYHPHRYFAKRACFFENDSGWRFGFRRFAKFSLNIEEILFAIREFFHREADKHAIPQNDNLNWFISQGA